MTRFLQGFSFVRHRQPSTDFVGCHDKQREAKCFRIWVTPNSMGEPFLSLFSKQDRSLCLLPEDITTSSFQSRQGRRSYETEEVKSIKVTLPINLKLSKSSCWLRKKNISPIFLSKLVLCMVRKQAHFFLASEHVFAHNIVSLFVPPFCEARDARDLIAVLGSVRSSESSTWTI